MAIGKRKHTFFIPKDTDTSPVYSFSFNRDGDRLSFPVGYSPPITNIVNSIDVAKNLYYAINFLNVHDSPLMPYPSCVVASNRLDNVFDVVATVPLVKHDVEGDNNWAVVSGTKITIATSPGNWTDYPSTGIDLYGYRFSFEGNYSTQTMHIVRLKDLTEYTNTASVVSISELGVSWRETMRDRLYAVLVEMKSDSTIEFGSITATQDGDYSIDISFTNAMIVENTANNALIEYYVGTNWASIDNDSDKLTVVDADWATTYERQGVDIQGYRFTLGLVDTDEYEWIVTKISDGSDYEYTVAVTTIDTSAARNNMRASVASTLITLLTEMASDNTITFVVTAVADGDYSIDITGTPTVVIAPYLHNVIVCQDAMVSRVGMGVTINDYDLLLHSSANDDIKPKVYVADTIDNTREESIYMGYWATSGEEFNLDLNVSFRGGSRTANTTQWSIPQASKGSALDFTIPLSLDSHITGYFTGIAGYDLPYAENSKTILFDTSYDLTKYDLTGYGVMFRNGEHRYISSYLIDDENHAQITLTENAPSSGIEGDAFICKSVGYFGDVCFFSEHIGQVVTNSSVGQLIIRECDLAFDYLENENEMSLVASNIDKVLTFNVRIVGAQVENVRGAKGIQYKIRLEGTLQT